LTAGERTKDSGQNGNMHYQIQSPLVRFEAFTAVTMKNGVFWDVTPHGVTSQKTPFFKNWFRVGGNVDKANGVPDRGHNITSLCGAGLNPLGFEPVSETHQPKLRGIPTTQAFRTTMRRPL
jgi:hypothetical protein